MSRVQLAINVSDVDAAVDFCSKLFATPVAKRKPGCANFEIAEPVTLGDAPAAQTGCC